MIVFYRIKCEKSTWIRNEQVGNWWKKTPWTGKTYLDILIVEQQKKRRWKCTYKKKQHLIRAKTLNECLHSLYALFIS